MKRFGWCKEECPRQVSGRFEDCDCGGAEKGAAMVVAYMHVGACHHPQPPVVATHFGGLVRGVNAQN